MSAHFENLKLVREQGAPEHDGYNPIAPRSHRWMMDAGELEETRIFGWVLWRTIDRDPKGRTGPAKKRRTAFVHDERCGRHGHLDVKHLAEDLGMSPANATDGLRRLVEKHKIRIDEKGRILPCGDAPEPVRIKGEDDGNGDDKEAPIFFCTENCPEAFRLSFQSLDKKRRAQYVRLYRLMGGPRAEHYEQLDPEARARHTWRYLEAAEYKEQLEADALAAARSRGREEIDRADAEAGFVDTETRGRKEVSRELTVELRVRVEPQVFSVQKKNGNSVQSQNPNLYKGEIASEQKSASLLVSQSDQSEQSEVESVAVEKELSRTSDTPSTPPSAPLTENHELRKGGSEASGEPPFDALYDPHPVINSVQQFFRRKLAAKDPLRGQFAALAGSLGIPDISVCRFLGEKLDRKRNTRYTIHTPGALYQIAVKDLPGWIEQREREIEADCNYLRNNPAASEPGARAQKAGQA